MKIKNMSFKVKTILGIAFIESILLAIIYFTSVSSLNETNENQIKTRADETSSLISLWVRNALLTYDVANTEFFINSLVETDGLVYVHIRNKDGATFAFAGDTKYSTHPNEADFTLAEANKDGVFDANKPVFVEDVQIGTVEIGLSVTKLSQFIDDVSHRIKVIAIIEIFLSALFSFILGWLLTRRLDRLKQVAVKVKESGKLVKIGDDSGDEIGMVSQAFDQMSASLIDTQVKLKSHATTLEGVFNNTKEGMVVFSTDGTILEANPAFMNLINCFKDVKGETYQSFIELLKNEIDFEDFESVNWLKGIESFGVIPETSENTKNVRLVKPNHRLLSVTIQPINEPENHIHSIFYFKDLTKTEEVERLKSEFLAHAAHELRTPLSSVQGFSELLMSPDVSEEMRIDFAQIINTQSQRVVALVGDLLDISKIEAEGAQNFQFEYTSVKNIVEKVIAEFSVPKGREPVIVKCSKKLGNNQIDIERVYQVILNLVSNAYKYSSTGDVQVFVERLETTLDGKNTIATVVRVVDSGIGMTESQVSSIFEKFWRADLSGEIPGTGLGMAIVKDIVTLHSGSIDVKSELGKGTEVVVTFYR